MMILIAKDLMKELPLKLYSCYPQNQEVKGTGCPKKERLQRFNLNFKSLE